jgi:hypothetical protein
MGRRGRNNRVLMLGLTLPAASSTRVDARNTSVASVHSCSVRVLFCAGSTPEHNIEGPRRVPPKVPPNDRKIGPRAHVAQQRTFS